MIRFLLTLCMSVLLCSCASRTHLIYPPENESFKEVPMSGEIQSDAIKVAVENLKDAREKRDVIGAKKNGFGQEVVTIKTDDDVPNWATDAVAYELERGGYRVERVPRGKGPISEYLISGDLITTYGTVGFTYQGEVALLIRVERGNKVILEEPYYGKADTKLSMFARTKVVNTMLAEALRRAVQDFLKDFNALAR